MISYILLEHAYKPQKSVYCQYIVHQIKIHVLKMSTYQTDEMKEIAVKLQNILQISQQLQEIFSSNSGQYQSNNEIATEDIKSLMTMLTAMKECSEVMHKAFVQ